MKDSEEELLLEDPEEELLLKDPEEELLSKELVYLNSATEIKVLLKVLNWPPRFGYRTVCTLCSFLRSFLGLRPKQVLPQSF